MDGENEARSSATLLATLAAALGAESRRSAHPSDRAALLLAAARIARALEAEFRLLPRHEASARLTQRGQMKLGEHE
jgi:hypothetical protein